MQIREALQQAKQILKAAAIDTASLDANLLLSHVTSLSKVMLIAHDEDELSKEQEDKFFSLINKRKSGYPIAYILGYKEFFGLRLKVTEDTLIPRPDTETLVEKALAFNPQGKVLDLGTGTGAIILALKSELKSAIDAYAVDLSKKALEVASFNSQKLNLPVTFIQSNWFSMLGDLKFSMIVSNPPYIQKDDIHLTQTSLPFEPIQALTSEEDGLLDIKLICKEAKAHLENGAPLLIEHGFNQGEKVRAIFTEQGYKNVATIKDLGGNDRVTFGSF
ncbi:MAG: peptide chain release factor N(5)-glutamine methyltransferase [Succinivibrio sp.]|nr:peptide chain release factor N(5)-glutamine methyltransferase [Succinivibrio sp.]MDY5188596.1 peptide chain release factor N(5)-glutamine methyltransferase [Succinivibrio sp.]MDY5324684.1 peptide chain release factor N(5)-glutamine methyltransferase [Succinivibrio sp.]